MHIFLSYPRKDAAKARQLQDALTGGGHVVWMDDQIIIGQHWRDTLETEIRRADAVVLALTPNWVASPFCQWEFVTGVENGKPIIPVLLVTGTRLPQRISQYQYADLSGGFHSAAVQKLLDDLLVLATTVDSSVIAGEDKAEYARQIDFGNETIVGDGNTVTKISIGGNVTGGIVNVGGEQTFRGNVTINTNAISASEEHRQELAALVKQLNAALTTISPEDAEVIQSLAQAAVDEVSKDKPNKRLLEIKGENLKRAAENLAAVAPIAVKIAKTLLMIG